MTTVPLFIPCIADPLTGRLNRAVSHTPMTYDDARGYLERHHAGRWKACAACVQPAALVAHRLTSSTTKGKP